MSSQASTAGTLLEDVLQVDESMHDALEDEWELLASSWEERMSSLHQ